MPGAGGIFLAAHQPTNHPSHLTTPYRLFRSCPDESALIASCNRANANFHDTHAKLATNALAGIRHIVVYLNFNVSLWQRNEAKEYAEIQTVPSPALSAPYILAKTILHKKVEINLLWDALMAAEIDKPGMHEGLTSILGDLTAISRQVKQHSSRLGAVVKPSITLMNRSISAIQDTLTCQSPRQVKKYQEQYLQDTSELMGTLSQLVCDLQMRGLRNIVSCWRANHSVHLDSSRIMIVGTKAPRKEMIEITCFQTLYEEAGIVEAEHKGYVMYVESPAKQMSTIQIRDLISDYGKHLLNKKIGKRILGDELAMEEDVLGKYAQSSIDRLRKEGCPYKPQ
ncbi:hypothetical protein [Legionella oakridgensis]|uniref:hypothetical protein n=1 Tax=Legionella oakridgensis TaxID=29423 RepID=UPI0003DE57D7|nr:hypothetical protein [Legionella oakridgensis]ETO93912.1 hypothetical protein LOR_78c22420 [Legionella oakridgensis RV-2-2007]